jgi:hypothetical protein
VPDTRSATPFGQSNQSGTRLTGAWGDDAGADPRPADVPPPVVGGGAAVARALGTVLMLPDETLPGTVDREPGVAELRDIDPTAPVFVVGVGEDAAPFGVAVVGAGVVAAVPVDVVGLVGALVMLPVLVPVCPLTWPAAGAASPTLSSKANLNECAVAIPLPRNGRQPFER